MKQFTIIREKWLRGDEDTSMLLDDTGCRCCLGSYLQACGLTDAQLQDRHVPADVRGGLPVEAQWLRRVIPIEGARQFTQDFHLMEVNDNEALTDAEREASITKLFKEQGIEVLFVDA